MQWDPSTLVVRQESWSLHEGKKCHETKIPNEKMEVKQDWGGMAGMQSRQHSRESALSIYSVIESS